MGMYDQLLGLTQQGLDRSNQIAMTSAQQPTMADVFMDRFRQGGQDQLARQKAAEEAKMHEATMKLSLIHISEPPPRPHVELTPPS